MVRTFARLTALCMLALSVTGQQQSTIVHAQSCPYTSSTAYIWPQGYGYTRECGVSQTGGGTYWHDGTTDAQVGPASIAVYVFSRDYITISHTNLTVVQQCNSRDTGTVSTWGYSLSAQTQGRSSTTCGGTHGSNNWHWYEGVSTHTRNGSQTVSTMRR